MDVNYMCIVNYMDVNYMDVNYMDVNLVYR